jgi:hypothetical protein
MDAEEEPAQSDGKDEQPGEEVHRHAPDERGMGREGSSHTSMPKPIIEPIA